MGVAPALVGVIAACVQPDVQIGDDGDADSDAGDSSDPGDDGSDGNDGIDGGDGDGDPNEELRPFVSGTRLRARALVSAEDPTAVAALIRWYDQSLELDCLFVDTVDQEIRCLPVDSLVIRGYSTPDCAPGSEIAVIAGQAFDCDVGTAVYWQNSAEADETCGAWLPEYGGVQLGEKLPLTDSYHDNTGTCTLLSKPSPEWKGNYCRYELLPAATFVGASLDVTEVGTLERHTLRGDDGSVEVRRAYDPVLGEPVYPDRGRLLPSVSGSAPGFADEACTEPAACGAPCPDIGVLWTDSCSADVALLGAAKIPGWWAEDMCVAAPFDQNSWCRVITEIRPAIEYQLRNTGGGRLRRSWIERGGVALVPHDDYFYDTVLDTLCRADESTAYRCEHHDWDLASVFSDPECLDRIGAEYKNTCQPPPNAVAGADGPLKVVPAPEFAGPTYTRNGQPDEGQAFNCTQRPEPTPLYELVPAGVDWASLSLVP